jgi:hypothetical protein
VLNTIKIKADNILANQFHSELFFLKHKELISFVAEGGAKICGVFRVKNHDFTPKNHIFFSNFRGAPPTPWVRPCNGRSILAQDLFIYFFTVYSYCVFKIILRYGTRCIIQPNRQCFGTNLVCYIYFLLKITVLKSYDYY